MARAAGVTRPGRPRGLLEVDLVDVDRADVTGGREGFDRQLVHGTGAGDGRQRGGDRGEVRGHGVDAERHGRTGGRVEDDLEPQILAADDGAGRDVDGEGLATQVGRATVDAEGDVDLALGGVSAGAAEGGSDGQRTGAAVGVGRRAL